jgi:hypothetical protein
MYAHVCMYVAKLAAIVSSAGDKQTNTATVGASNQSQYYVQAGAMLALK